MVVEFDTTFNAAIFLVNDKQTKGNCKSSRGQLNATVLQRLR